MSKITIADAAIKLGVSKEAIHNRIRRGSLQSVFEDGVKYVILNNETKTTNKQTSRRANTKVIQKPDLRYYQLLEEQNQKLQEKVEKLEGETKTLREQKEEMLVQERIRIEQIYKDKDEQLKNILSAMSSKLMLNSPSEDIVIENEDLLEAEIEPETKVEVVAQKKPKKKTKNELVSLKKYLKSKKYSKNKIQKIVDKFQEVARRDSRIILVGKKYYVNPVKFDYSDLLLHW
jgi:TolA-binding protein